MDATCFERCCLSLIFYVDRPHNEGFTIVHFRGLWEKNLFENFGVDERLGPFKFPLTLSLSLCFTSYPGRQRVSKCVRVGVYGAVRE